MFSIKCGWVKWGKHRGAKPDLSFSISVKAALCFPKTTRDCVFVSKKEYIITQCLFETVYFCVNVFNLSVCVGSISGIRIAD